MTAVVVLGVFNADTTYRAERLPRLGETLMGAAFSLGPGGKGSNQAVAAARLGADVTLVSRVGDDAFADLAFGLWRDTGVTPAVRRDPARATGAACIFVDDATGDNAIIICPGAAGVLAPADLDDAAPAIRGAKVFMTQLEQPLEAAVRGLEIARAAGVTTILNPAPARPLEDAVLQLVDFLTPNATEAEALTGVAVQDRDSAERAARHLLARGVGTVVLTLGGDGAILVEAERAVAVPAIAAGPVVETTGAGDAFNGGFAVGIAEGQAPDAAARFASAVAGLAVTRAGAAAAMPTREDVESLIAVSRPQL